MTTHNNQDDDDDDEGTDSFRSSGSGVHVVPNTVGSSSSSYTNPMSEASDVGPSAGRTETLLGEIAESDRGRVSQL